MIFLQLKAKFEKQIDDIIPIAVKSYCNSRYRRVFDAYLAGQEMSEFKAVMTEGVSEDGGYTVPITYQNTVLQKLNTLSRTRSIPNVLTTTSTRNIPVEV
ncbi:phage major capsid protein [Aliarcobacter butzleri]|uniref:phage major capsid protein n=1 Tax=Aliarcobacter butzleri TaxID=28197 RepID=UPI0021B4B2AB|nr:phage major capsid protein [Aliarcobacter butzleri]UXC29222.1 phage major capsid protein [Aliarcobacter butzleri]